MWQPIETAPKDQTFLAVLNCAGEQIICTMRWAVAEAKNSRPDHYAFHVERVTHWMPLPDLPSAQPAPSAPEGGKLVLIEPTPGMMRGAHRLVAAARRVLASADSQGLIRLDESGDVASELRSALEAAPEAKVEPIMSSLNLSDPAVQKRLAAQWGYVPASEMVAPDLLEALKTLTSMAEMSPSELHQKHPDVVAARAAITKATEAKP